MANNNFVKFAERFNRTFHAFCVHVYDLAGVPGKYLDENVEREKFTLGVFIKDTLSKLGIHTKDARRLYREMYRAEGRALLRRQNIGNRRPIRKSLPQWYRNFVYGLDTVARGARLLVKRSPLSVAFRRWRKEAYQCSDHGIRIKNAGSYNASQLGQLRKLARRGYDISRLENPNLSALDMRLAVPFLKNTEAELTHETILELRRESFSMSVDDFFLDVLRIKVNEQKDELDSSKAMQSSNVQDAISNVDFSKLDHQEFHDMMDLVKLQQKLQNAEQGIGLDWLLLEPNLKVQSAALDYLQKHGLSFEEWRDQNLDKCLLRENRREYDFLQQKAFSDEEGERVHVAQRGYFLDVLLHDNSAAVRKEVAKHQYGLDVLMKDTDPRVRAEVVKQGYRLDTFVHDPDRRVRREVAKLGHGLEALIFDEDSAVRGAARKSLFAGIRASGNPTVKQAPASLDSLVHAASSDQDKRNPPSIPRSTSDAIER